MQTDPILEKNLESLIKTQTTLKQPSPAQQAALLSLLKQETAAFAQHRITSYNVCYTKLLRR